jgi:hypothetical protein
MPYSGNAFDAAMQAVMKLLAPSEILDIGVGAGKYGRLAWSAVPETDVTGIEIEPSYVGQFGLSDLYSRLLITDVSTWMETPEALDAAFPLVIIGDTIEHLRKSAGVDLLHFCLYRCAYLALLYPERYIQGAWLGYPHEAHVSIWGAKDFDGFDHSPIWEDGCQRFVMLRGFQPSLVALEEVIACISTFH